jgi:hypothetical protein
MKHPLVFLPPFVLGFLALFGAQTSGCNGQADSPADAGTDSAVGNDAAEDAPANLPPDDATTNCTVNAKEDYIDFCLQKQILVAEHKVFSPTGVASSWNANTGQPDTDGGLVVHDYRDDIAYGASLATYSISASVYGDTEIAGTVVAPDLTALAPLVLVELAPLPQSYDGETYMRLRRFAQGLNLLPSTDIDGAPNGAGIDALADAYGRAIYTTYFHPLAPGASDAGTDGGGADAGDDAGNDAGEADAASDAGLAQLPIADGILGVSQPGGGFLYDVDQAASGALALADLASRHETDDPTSAHAWARAAGSVFNHLYTRARHSSGLYYTYLVTSSDPDHDALATVITPNDALLTETQASVAASLLRTSGLVTTDNLVELSLYPFADQVRPTLNAVKGLASDGGAGFSLWDPTPTPATTAACLTDEDASSACGGSGFFVQWLPSGTGLDNSAKTIRGNALLFAALYRAIVPAPNAASIDFEPLQALFEDQEGILGYSFMTLVFMQNSYPDAVSATLGFLQSDPSAQTFTAQANAYAIEALTEQWVGQMDCPAQFY